MVQMIIEIALGNFPIIMTVLALILGVLVVNKKSSSIEACLSYLFFLAMGLVGIWGFIFHAFFPQVAASLIGWSTSPFQFEVAVANLGLGVVGIFGFNASRGYRIAATIFTTCFLWGAAYGHVVQMLKANNFAPGNAGLIFYNDILLPLLLIIFLSVSKDNDKYTSYAETRI
jgi:hypothetical protein